MDEKMLYCSYPKPEKDEKKDEYKDEWKDKDDCRCIIKKDVKFDRCEDFKCEDICGEVKCEGRILKVNVKIKKVCVDKAISIAVLLCEKDKVLAFNVIKAKNDPWDHKKHWDDTIEKTFIFAIPDEDISKERCFTINVLAHFIETHIECPCK